MLLQRSAARRITTILLVATLSISLNLPIKAFNIDTGDVKVFAGSEGSHFGYTMSFDSMAVTQGHVNLLIGAPKTKRAFTNGELHETGALITCYDVLNDIKNCKVEAKDNVFPTSIQLKKNQVYLDEVSHINGGYGYGLSVSASGSRLICAPFWKDVKFVKEYGLTFMPGRCAAYLQKEGKTEIKNVMPYFRGWRYVQGGNYFTGLAEFGLSADIYEDWALAVGVPGLTISEGGVALFDLRGEERKLYTTTKEYRNTLGTTAYGYLGYQVIFGKFCESTNICFAAGAPSLDSVGGVRLYHWANEELLINFQTLYGQEAFSYFGSAICAVDTDRDGIDELLVGAPHYNTGTPGRLDIGKAYLYKKVAASKEFDLLLEIHGPKSAWSRFGTAIQTIGDINLDGYFDVAIGAPGEEEGSGCVYIYLGYGAGGVILNQRICAHQITGLQPPVSGFGSSLSGASQSQRSPYPIFAVGLFTSDKVLLFRSRPILDVTATLTVNPNPVDVEKKCTFLATDGPCALIILCMEHNIRKSPLTQDLQSPQSFGIDIKLDAQRQSRGAKRAAFQNEGKMVESLQLSMDIKPKGPCLDFSIVIQKENLERDRFTPIQVEFTYDLEHNQHSRGSSTPILDPRIDRKIYHTITFANDCGSDNICRVDLKAEQSLIYPTARNGDIASITLGHTKELTVLVTVSNSQETCYLTEIKVRLDQPLDMSRYNSDTIRDCRAVQDMSNPKGTTIVCTYYQPLEAGVVIGATLTFESDNLADDTRSLSISTEAKSRDQKYNPEMYLRDNKVQQLIDVYIVANVSILGNAIPLEMKIGKGKKISTDVFKDIQPVSASAPAVINKIMLNHKVLIRNKGPSFLPKTKVLLEVPVYIPDGTLLVTNFSVKLILSGSQMIDCSKPVNGSILKLVDAATATPVTSVGEEEVTRSRTGDVFRAKRVKRDTQDVGDDEHVVEDTTFTMSCDETPQYCLTFSCGLPRVIQSGGHAELNVTLTLDGDNIPLPEKISSFRLELKTVLEEPDHKLLKPWNATQMKQVEVITHTTFHWYETGGTINPWIIAGSVVAGLLLILLIVVICWKVGFFERKQHHQVTKWKRESVKSKRGSERSRKESQSHKDK